MGRIHTSSHRHSETCGDGRYYLVSVWGWSPRLTTRADLCSRQYSQRVTWLNTLQATQTSKQTKWLRDWKNKVSGVIQIKLQTNKIYWKNSRQAIFGACSARKNSESNDAIFLPEIKKLWSLDEDVQLVRKTSQPTKPVDYRSDDLSIGKFWNGDFSSELVLVRI